MLEGCALAQIFEAGAVATGANLTRTGLSAAVQNLGTVAPAFYLGGTFRRLRLDYVPGHIIQVLWPTRLCDRGNPGGPSQSWNSVGAAETGHIT